MTAPHQDTRLSTNRKALRDYFILERIEAGIALHGSEVKSIRAGGLDFAGAYASIVNDELILGGLRIAHYSYSHNISINETRPRRLLVHRAQIRKLRAQLDQKGLTVVPLSAYLNNQNRIKIEIGVCKGKNVADKRETLRRKTAEREADRAMRHRG